jgi:hypothetical protein
MHPSFKGYKYVGYFLLTAAMTATAAVKAGAQEVVITHEGDHTRYYDRNHHDYHEWNDNEDRSYRVYLGERHREYSDFHHENSRRQRAYWNWRHSHPDHRE